MSISNEIVGTLYGVDISLPLQRSEVREVVKARKILIETLMREKNINESQASLDTFDIFKEFVKKLSEEDANNLADLVYEESEALLPSAENLDASTLKDINIKAEAEQNHLQAQFIYHALSANLSVYGSNSSLTVANPANIDLALDYINRSLELCPDNAIYLNLKGLLLWEGKKDKASALPLIQKAAKLKPNDIAIQNNLKSIEDPKGCFIATAAYGTPVADDINELRYWRDITLSESIYGRAFIKVYYKISPPIANRIATRPTVKKIVRTMLKPLISYVRTSNKK
jgi:tetratricopeptide (TPR) repeat protein